MSTDTTATDTRHHNKAHSAVLRRSQAFGGVVQAKDLRGALRALLRRPGAPTQRVLAMRSGVPERTISRILHGHDRTTRFDIADALFVALDAESMLDELCPAEAEVSDG